MVQDVSPQRRHRRPNRLTRRAHLGSFADPNRGPIPRQPLLQLALPLIWPVSGVFRGRTDRPVFALTYDDGPDPSSTPAVLDELARSDAKATFFVLASRAEQHADLVTRAAREGHEVALHGWDHTRLSSLPLRSALASIRRARATVEDISQSPIRYFRPPHGALTPTQMAAVRAMGMTPVLWSAWARDWTDHPAKDLGQHAASLLHPGCFLLLHDSRADPETATEDEPLPTFDRGVVLHELLNTAREAGYAATTVGQLLQSGPAYLSYAREFLDE